MSHEVKKRIPAFKNYLIINYHLKLITINSADII